MQLGAIVEFIPEGARDKKVALAGFDLGECGLPPASWS
jgi:hypothetical protein